MQTDLRISRLGPRLRGDDGINPVAGKSLKFYLESREPIVLSSGENGLLLLINADKKFENRFHGYDFIALVATPNNGAKITAALVPLNANKERNGKIQGNVVNNASEMSLPKKSLGLTKSKFEFDFHWIDNIDHRSSFNPKLGRFGEAVNGNGLRHPDFPQHGVSVPDRRFNYRFSAVAKTLIRIFHEISSILFCRILFHFSSASRPIGFTEQPGFLAAAGRSGHGHERSNRRR